MRNLNTFVHAVERDETGGIGRSQVFGPGDPVPDWARAAITNPDVWDGDEEPSTAPSTAPVTAVKEPPRRGPGSGGPAWIEFAGSKGVTQQFDSKDALIAHLEEHGHIEKG